MEPRSETRPTVDTEFPPERPCVRLYVRTPADYGTHERQRAVVSRLERLCDEDHVAEYAVEPWGRSVVIAGSSSAGPTGDTHDAVADFREWAAEAGRTLEPAFREQHHSELGAVSHTRLTLPVVCLAVYDEDDDVVAVFPNGDGRRVHTVADALDAFERDDEQWRGFASEPSASTHS